MLTDGVIVWFSSVFCVLSTQVLKDLVLAISPTVQHDSLKGWTMKYLMRLDGVQQQQKIPAECTLPTGALCN